MKRKFVAACGIMMAVFGVSAELVLHYDFQGADDAARLAGKGSDKTAAKIVVKNKCAVEFVNDQPFAGKSAVVFKNVPGQKMQGSALVIPGTAGKLAATEAGQKLTIALWVKADKPDAEGGLIGCGNGGHSSGWMFGTSNKNGGIAMTGCGTFGTRFSKDDSLKPGVWTHVALTWDVGAPEGIRFYMDGERVESSLNFISAKPCGKDAAEFVIGAKTPGQWQAFGGAVSDVRVYDEILSADAILALAARP